MPTAHCPLKDRSVRGGKPPGQASEDSWQALHCCIGTPGKKMRTTPPTRKPTPTPHAKSDLRCEAMGDMKTGNAYLIWILYVHLYMYMCVCLSVCGCHTIPYLRDIKHWVRSTFSSGQTTHSFLCEDLRRYFTKLRHCMFFLLEALLAPRCDDGGGARLCCAGEPDRRETPIWRHRCEVSNHQRRLFHLRSQFQTSRFVSCKHSKYSLISSCQEPSYYGALQGAVCGIAAE